MGPFDTAAGTMRCTAHPRSTAASAPAPGRIAKALTAAVLEDLPAAARGDSEALHRLRVASRRMRVALALLCSHPNGKRVRHAKRELRRWASASRECRDLDVCLEQVANLRRASSSVRAALEADLSRARGRAGGRLARALRSDAGRDPRLLLESASERVLRSTASALRRQRAFSRIQCERADELASELGRELDPEGMHSLRRRIRRLRYALELGDQLRGGGTGATKGLRDLQDTLGRWRDSYLLSEQASRSASAASRRGERRLASALASTAAELRRRIEEEQARLLAGQPRRLLERARKALDGPNSRPRTHTTRS
jgi:CHAD domain-containing protein